MTLQAARLARGLRLDPRRRLRTALRGAFERSPELRAAPEFLASIGRRVHEQESRRRSAWRWRPLMAIAASLLLVAELTVLERHSCVYDRRGFAHIVLRYRGTLVSVLVTPGRLARVPPELAADGTSMSPFRVGRFATFVVSSANDAETREIAAAVAGPLKNALAGA